jgi:ABC-type uncharacterized transport system auxiliary subunit
MIMSLPRRWYFGLLLLWVAGCISFHLPKAAPPVYYQLDYRPFPVRCSRHLQEGVRIWNFATSAPYSRTEMVVVEPDGTVSFSGGFQWVATPGVLVAESLVRDLNLSKMFSQVVSSKNPANVPLEMSGHIFRFAWERHGETAQAGLQVEVSLVDTKSTRKVIFRKEYNLQSRTFLSDSSAAFAMAMSELTRQFSEKVQQDLCAALGAAH